MMSVSSEKPHTKGRIDSALSKVRQATVHSVSDSVLCSWRRRHVRSFDEDHQPMEDQSRIQRRNHVERNKLKVLRIQHPTSTQVQALCTYRQNVADFLMYPGRDIFMGMTNELKVSPNVHRGVEVNLRSAAIIRNYVGRFRPRYGSSSDQASEKSWDLDKWDKLENPEVGSPNITYY